MDQYLVNLFWAMCSNRRGTGAGRVITLQITPGLFHTVSCHHLILQLALFPVYRTESEQIALYGAAAALSWWKQLALKLRSKTGSS